MKRKELLTATFSEEKNQETVLAEITKTDQRFIKRSKRDLEDKIEDLETELENRLKSKTPLDKSVVEVTYQALVDARKELSLYHSFEEKYL